MISLREALDLYPQSLEALPSEICRLEEALGRVLAEPVASAVDLPPFTQSAVDGYALRCADVSAASADAPASLELIGDVPAGSPAVRGLLPGTAMRILTGGALPEGADASARQEIVERVGGLIRLRRPVPAGADTRYRGEELKAGEVIAQAGQRVASGLLAALAMAGVREVKVRARPRVVVLITGDEVVPMGGRCAPGQVHDANGPLLHGWFVERGYPEPEIHYVPDRPEAVARALSEALDTADFVISTGGVSVGDRDYLPQLAPELGIRKVFWQVAQKPGKPLWFGTRDGKAFMGLPGNPAAVLVGLAVHVAAVLSLLEGRSAPEPLWRTGILDSAVKADAHRDRLLRAGLDFDPSGRALLAVLPRQDSHMLSNLAQATALIWLPAREAPYAAGDGVRWTALQA
jgi:molybdopterin molybdotransferase